jgi:hypothetical protein
MKPLHGHFLSSLPTRKHILISFVMLPHPLQYLVAKVKHPAIRLHPETELTDEFSSASTIRSLNTKKISYQKAKDG